MKDYEDLVANAFRAKSELPFSNESFRHARVVMKHLLSNAEKRVYLYSDGLIARCDKENSQGEVYDWPELLDAAETFLSKDKTNRLDVKVVVSESDVNVSKKFVNLKNKFVGQVDFHWNARSGMPNFMVSDSHSFRIEYDEHQAIACANNSEVSQKLIDLFEKV